MKPIVKQTVLTSLALGALLYLGLVPAFGVTLPPSKTTDVNQMVRFWDRNAESSAEAIDPYALPPSEAPLGIVPTPALDEYAFVGWFRDTANLYEDPQGFLIVPSTEPFSGIHLRPKYQGETTPADYYAVWADANLYQAAVIDESKNSVTVYETIADASAAAKSAGAILKLLSPLSAGPAPVITVEEGQTLTLDMNGYGITRPDSSDSQAFLENWGTLSVENSSEQTSVMQSGGASGCLLTNHTGAVVPRLRDIVAYANTAFVNQGTIVTLTNSQFFVSSASENSGDIQNLQADFNEVNQLQEGVFLENNGSLHITDGSFTFLHSGSIVRGDGALTFPSRQALPKPNNLEDPTLYSPGRYTLVPLVSVSFYDEDRMTLLDLFESPFSETLHPAYSGEVPGKPDRVVDGVLFSYRFAGWQNADGETVSDDTIAGLRSDTTLYASYTPTQQTLVAQVGSDSYASLQAAIQAVTERGQAGTVQLLANVSLSVSEDALVIPSGTVITLDLQGHNITALAAVSVPAITNYGLLTLQGGDLHAQNAPCLSIQDGSVMIQGGQVVTAGTTCAAISHGNLQLSSGQLAATGDESIGLAVSGGSSVTITGDAQLSGTKAAIEVDGETAVVTLAGGYYRGAILGSVVYEDGMSLSSIANADGFFRVTAPQAQVCSPLVTGNTASIPIPDGLAVEKLAPLSLSALTGEESINQVCIQIPTKVVEQLDLTPSLTLQTDVGQVTFHREAVEAIWSGAKGTGVELSLAERALVDLPEAQKNAAATAQTILDITLTAGGRPLPLSNGTATIQLPFSPPEGTAPERYWVYYLSEDGVKTSLPSSYDKGMLSFTAPHFSTYLIDAAPCYHMTLTTDSYHYNLGDTINDAIYATSTQSSVCQSFQFTPVFDPEKLELLDVITDLPGYTVTSNTPMTYIVSGADTPVGTDPLLVAKMIFRVKDVSPPSNTILSLEHVSILPEVSFPVLSPQITEKEVSLHHIKITLNADEHSTVSGESSITLFAKYQQPGLYQTPYESPISTVPLTAHTGYRLADQHWTDGSNEYPDFTALADRSFSQDATFTLQTAKTCTISFMPAAHGSLSSFMPITVDIGTVLSSAPLPTPIEPDGYTFVGWYLEGNPVRNDYTVTDNITLTPNFSRLTFFFKSTSPNASLNVLSGLTELEKVAYGVDFTFRLSPRAGYAVTHVRYEIDGNESLLFPDDNGVYTIPGEQIQGDVSLTVDASLYQTLKFQAAEGSTLSPVTAYIRAGIAGLYANDTFTIPFSCPIPTPLSGYRLAQDTVQEPLWQDNSGATYTTSALNAAVFTESRTLFPRTVPIWRVTFESGDNGTLKDTPVLSVDDGSTLPSDQFPAPTGNPGYVFDSWRPAATDPITQDTVFTAHFRKKTHAIDFTPVEGVSFQVISGVVQGQVESGRDVTFLLHEVPGCRLTGVQYVVGGGSAQSLEAIDGVYTIPGSAINDEIVVSVTVQETVTVTFVAGNHGSLAGTLTITVDKGATLSPEQIPTPQEMPGYRFLSWWANGVVVTPAGFVVTAPVTFTATFDSDSFPVTVSPGLTGPASTATSGEPFTFTPSSEGHLVIDVCFAVGDGDFQALLPNLNGSYTIPASSVTGPITIAATLVKGTFTFVSFDQYKAAPIGKQMVLLKTSQLSDRHYVLPDDGAFFWSSLYQSYVRFVDQSETAASLSTKLTTSAGSAPLLNYNGDLTNSGAVTAADADLINDLLHGNLPSASDQLRLEMDVDGNQSISTSDMQWLLDAAVGNHHRP